MSAQKIIKVTSTRKIIKSKGGAQTIPVYHRSGENAFSSGSKTLTVTFTNVTPDSSYAIHGGIRNPTDAVPGFYNWIITDRRTNGFDVELNFAPENGNYLFMWQCIGFNNG